MPKLRQARLLLTLSMVLGAHLVAVWLLLSSHQLSVKTGFGSLQLVLVTPPASLKTAPEPKTPTQRLHRVPSQQRSDRASVLPSNNVPPNEESKAIHADWNAELHRAAQDAVAQESAKKRHEFDFAHAYPTTPRRPPQFAWDYAATHRVESLPQGGMLIHLGDHCVLALIPLPIVACALGKSPANGDLFQHMHN
jgi:hypothetical protein